MCGQIRPQEGEIFPHVGFTVVQPCPALPVCGLAGHQTQQVQNRLLYADGRYTIDFEDFERKITDNRVKAFLLCSPHNPIGRVWTAEELQRLGGICRKDGSLAEAEEYYIRGLRLAKYIYQLTQEPEELLEQFQSVPVIFLCLLQPFPPLSVVKVVLMLLKFLQILQAADRS